MTRSFGRPVTDWEELREAVAAFAARAGEKLRAGGLQATAMTVFAHTNPHGDDPWHSATRSARIEPTSDTLALIAEAVRLLRACWRPGFHYAKAGVMLAELVPDRQCSTHPAALLRQTESPQPSTPNSQPSQNLPRLVSGRAGRPLRAPDTSA